MEIKVYAIKDCGIDLACEDVLLTVKVDKDAYTSTEDLCKDIKKKFDEKDQEDLSWGLPDLKGDYWKITKQSFPEDCDEF